MNTISAGPLGSRAAKAIGFIDDMIRCVSGALGLNSMCVAQSATSLNDTAVGVVLLAYVVDRQVSLAVLLLPELCCH